jgi:hypothetical protein
MQCVGCVFANLLHNKQSPAICVCEQSPILINIDDTLATTLMEHDLSANIYISIYIYIYIFPTMLFSDEREFACCMLGPHFAARVVTLVKHVAVFIFLVLIRGLKYIYIYMCIYNIIYINTT